MAPKLVCFVPGKVLLNLVKRYPMLFAVLLPSCFPNFTGLYIYSTDRLANSVDLLISLWQTLCKQEQLRNWQEPATLNCIVSVVCELCLQLSLMNDSLRHWLFH